VDVDENDPHFQGGRLFREYQFFRSPGNLRDQPPKKSIKTARKARTSGITPIPDGCHYFGGL
jgi:hypothetical protein